MSFAAEPYGVFVDDLLSSLTGGITREQFAFPPLDASHQLAFRDDYVPATIRVHGLVDGAHTRFERLRDFVVDEDGIIDWLALHDIPPASALLPDEGTSYFVSYERKPETHGPPLLTDRNPGSVVRTLAESFAREYAVLSKQLDKVYRSGFLETAKARDLDQLVALVGVSRRGKLHARGEITFARATPAAADIFIPAGTQVSTRDVPAVTVETSEARTLSAGSMSVAVPVVSLQEGQAGVVSADQLRVLHRPILGIESVRNAQALRVRAQAETDESLRERAKRSLQRYGAATGEALRGALIEIDGIRPQDIEIIEDDLTHSGVLRITIAADLNTEQAQLAWNAMERVRPAGIRVIHNLILPPQNAEPDIPDAGAEASDEPPAPAIEDGVWSPIALRAKFLPSSSQLDAQAKAQLAERVKAVLLATVDELGIGEPVIYHRLVHAAMSVSGVQDILLEVFPRGALRGRSNIRIPAGTRARIEAADAVVDIAGSFVALDLEVQAEPKGRWLTTSMDQARAHIRDAIVQKLENWLVGAGTLGVSGFVGALPATYDYEVTGLHFRAEYPQQGLTVLEDDPVVELLSDQRGWLRSLTLQLPGDDAP